MATRDLKTHLKFAQSLAPAARTASANGTGVDLQDCDSAIVEIALGLWTDGSYTWTVEESTDDGNTDAYAAVAAGDLIGAFTVVDGVDDDNVIQRVGYKGNKRWIRAVVTEAGASPSPSTGLVCAATVIKGHLHSENVG